MLNLTCNVAASRPSDFFVLNDNCFHVGTGESGQSVATTVLFSILSIVAFTLALVTYLRYNSVSILSYSIHIDAISNNWWIFHFVIVGLRAVVVAFQHSYGSRREGLFLSFWYLGAVELLLFCLALNYQRKFRSSGYVTSETAGSRLNGEAKLRDAALKKGLFQAFASSRLVICMEFLVVIIAICLFLYAHGPRYSWFWVYVAFLLGMHASALVLVVIIACTATADGPFLKVKVFLLLAVILSTPADIPIFIWKHCGHMSCWGEAMTMYDLWLIMKIISILMIFLALYFEYRRLRLECQWAMLNEIQGFSF